jgi:hypothetical protein
MAAPARAGRRGACRRGHKLRPGARRLRRRACAHLCSFHSSHPPPAPRCICALALRAWFAGDVANTPALLARLCDPRSESGRMCQWRHSAVNALLATAGEVAAGAEGAEGSARAEAHRSALAAALGQLRAAAAAGPYGAAGAGGGAASHDQHFVANRPR